MSKTFPYLPIFTLKTLIVTAFVVQYIELIVFYSGKPAKLKHVWDKEEKNSLLIVYFRPGIDLLWIIPKYLQGLCHGTDVFKRYLLYYNNHPIEFWNTYQALTLEICFDAFKRHIFMDFRIIEMISI